MTQVVNAYLSWPFTKFRTTPIPSRSGRGIRHTLVLFLHAAIRILKIKRRNASLVVVHLSQRGSFIREGTLLVLASARGIPTVAHIHGSSFPAYAARHPWLVRLVLERSARVFVLSAKARATVHQVAHSVRAEIVPNAVPSGTSAAKRPNLVFGGAICRRKGVDVLLEAWSQLSGDKDDWKLLIAGPALEPELLEDLPVGVDVLGQLDHAELLDVLSASRVAVLPSRDEGMPMFLLEAMARRNCIVSTNVGGIPELLGDAGRIVPAGDPRALRLEIEALLRHPETLEKCAEACLQRFTNHFSAEQVYPRVEELWASIIAEQKGQPQ